MRVKTAELKTNLWRYVSQVRETGAPLRSSQLPRLILQSPGYRAAFSLNTLPESQGFLATAPIFSLSDDYAVIHVMLNADGRLKAIVPHSDLRNR